VTMHDQAGANRPCRCTGRIGTRAGARHSGRDEIGSNAAPFLQTRYL
jgi:hypothetical protein